MAISAKECDEYRREYPDMTLERLKWWHSRLWNEHRGQEHFNKNAIVQFFGDVKLQKYSVMEIGGWDGGLAKTVLDNHSEIACWDNFEICEEACGGSVCTDQRYRAINEQPRTIWQSVVVASHVFEHMSSHEIRGLVSEIYNQSRYLYVDLPNPHEVWGSTSFHIVNDALKHILPLGDGWEQIGGVDNAKWFKKWLAP